jgi:hypothetical protein
LKDLIKTLQKEKYEANQKYDEVRQELDDSKKDLRLLREQINRQRVGIQNEGLTTTIKLDNFLNLPSSKASPSTSMKSSSTTPIHSSISCYALSPSVDTNSSSINLLKENEFLGEQKLSLENDMKILLCRLEECEIERDAFKTKYNELDQVVIEQMNASDTNNNDNGSSSKRTPGVNLSEIMTEMKQLKATNQSLIKELTDLKTNKTLNQDLNDEASSADAVSLNLNKAQIKNLLKKSDHILANFVGAHKSLTNSDIQLALETISEFRKLVDQLLEMLNDRIIAGKHQRKINKLLAIRVQDLEKQLIVSKSDENPNKSLIKFDETNL